MVFVFGYFIVCHKDWVIYFGGTQIDLVNSVIIFISNNLNRMFKFPTQFLDCDSHSAALLDLFISSDTSICSTVTFPPLENSDRAKKINTFVSGNAGDKKNLHSGGHKFFFLSI